jgi:guanosine-3',5'-bis(diphosphate) 3'-pyrophosphohydrolase
LKRIADRKEQRDDERERSSGVMNVVDQAIITATRAFSGKTRKASRTPAIFHSLEAGAIAASMTDDYEVIAAVVLHDVIEDTDITVEELRRAFGDRITDLVLSDSENKREGLPPQDSWKLRKQEMIDYLRQVDDRDIQILYLSDKLSNLRSIYQSFQREGRAVWQRFNQKDEREQYWYYHTIAEELSDLREFPAWKEYTALIQAVFGASR